MSIVKSGACISSATGWLSINRGSASFFIIYVSLWFVCFNLTGQRPIKVILTKQNWPLFPVERGLKKATLYPILFAVCIWRIYSCSLVNFANMQGVYFCPTFLPITLGKELLTINLSGAMPEITNHSSFVAESHCPMHMSQTFRGWQ